MTSSHLRSCRRTFWWIDRAIKAKENEKRKKDNTRMMMTTTDDFNGECALSKNNQHNKKKKDKDKKKGWKEGTRLRIDATGPHLFYTTTTICFLCPISTWIRAWMDETVRCLMQICLFLSFCFVLSPPFPFEWTVRQLLQHTGASWFIFHSHVLWPHLQDKGKTCAWFGVWAICLFPCYVHDLWRCYASYPRLLWWVYTVFLLSSSAQALYWWVDGLIGSV